MEDEDGWYGMAERASARTAFNLVVFGFLADLTKVSHGLRLLSFACRLSAHHGNTAERVKKESPGALQRGCQVCESSNELWWLHQLTEGSWDTPVPSSHARGLRYDHRAYGRVGLYCRTPLDRPASAVHNPSRRPLLELPRLALLALSSSAVA